MEMEKYITPLFNILMSDIGSVCELGGEEFEE